PEVGDAVPLEWLGKAMSDPAYQQRIVEAFTEVRQSCGEEIDAFLRTRGIERPAEPPPGQATS
ncbi:MAG: hypothetical protein ACRD6W_13475, partial [Nitrososphaerales archaeon]